IVLLLDKRIFEVPPRRPGNIGAARGCGDPRGHRAHIDLVLRFFLFKRPAQIFWHSPWMSASNLESWTNFLRDLCRRAWIFRAVEQNLARNGPATGGRRQGQMIATVSKEFRVQMQGYGLTTAEIHYRMPDHPSLLQLYVWQEYDLAPDFPELRGFLDYWKETLEGALHSVRVAHHRLIKPSEWKAVDGIIAIH